MASVDSSSLVLDDWDMLKARSLSTDMTSPVPMESFLPFLFPMDPDVHPTPNVPSSTAPSPVLDANGRGATHDAMAQALVVPHYVSPKLEHQPRASPAQWQFEHHPPSSGPADGYFFTTPLSSAHHGTVGRPTPMFGGNMVPGVRAPLLQLPPHPQQHPRTSQHSRYTSPSSLVSTPSHMTMQPSTAPAAAAASTARTVPSRPSSNLPLADIQLLTKLNQCYWKNGRKNLQCFPICPEHNDFYSMKMSNRKHTSVGVCRGPVYTHVFLPACSPHVKPPRTTGQHMKYEFGVGASGTGGSAFEIFTLGKFERVPQRDENDALQELLPAPASFTSSSEFEAFRYSCFQAVEMEERRVTTRAAPDVAGLPDHIVRSTWFFLPDVWKVQPMLKKKRKATRSAPAQSFPFCFRVFVYVREPNGRETTTVNGAAGDDDDDERGRATGTYRCVATTASSFFELYSTRTVDRVKRKYWSRSDDDESQGDGDALAVAMATTPSSTHVAKRTSSRS